MNLKPKSREEIMEICRKIAKETLGTDTNETFIKILGIAYIQGATDVVKEL